MIIICYPGVYTRRLIDDDPRFKHLTSTWTLLDLMERTGLDIGEFDYDNEALYHYGPAYSDVHMLETPYGPSYEALMGYSMEGVALMACSPSINLKERWFDRIRERYEAHRVPDENYQMLLYLPNRFEEDVLAASTFGAIVGHWRLS